MWKIECLKKCKKCENYKNKYITQKKRIEELEKYVESILKTQKEICELMEKINNQK